MASGEFGAVLEDMQVLFDQGTAAGLTDGDLLGRFMADRGGAGQSAFTALVKRHGPMVLRVCRGELNDLHSAEDAFQATFLVLARQARLIRDRSSLASWLYGVVRRAARRARLERARRLERERKGARMLDEMGRHAPEPPDLLPEVQEEVDRLPERYRSLIVLCYLGGLTHEEAASQLAIPVGTVKIRLSRGRDRLRSRLIRRGLAPAIIAAALEAPARAALIPSSLVQVTVEAAMRVAAFQAAGVTASVAVLVQGVLRAMLIHKLRTAAIVLAASMGLLAASFVLVSAPAAPVLSRQETPRKTGPPKAARPDAAPVPKGETDQEVAVIAIKRTAFDHTIQLVGNAEAFQIVKVGAKVSGTLRAVMVNIGSSVRKGDVLAEFDAPELQLEFLRAETLARQARARFASAKSLVEVARTAVNTANVTLDAAVSELKGAQSQVEYRAKQSKRIEELVKTGAVEQRLLEEEQDRRQTASIAVETARLKVSVAKAGVEEARARLVTAMASIAELEDGQKLADIDRRKAELIRDSARVVSPIDGIVIERNCSTGEYIRVATNGGTQPLFTVVNSDVMRIVTSVPDSIIPLVDVGDPASFRSGATPTESFRARLPGSPNPRNARPGPSVSSSTCRIPTGSSAPG